MHVLIITDLEGVSGVDTMDMVMDESAQGYADACRYLMEDTNAAIDGAFAGGATAVTVIDGHRTGYNFIKEMLDPRAVQMSAFDMIPAHVSTFKVDAVMCVGAHAMAGTVGAFLDHTQSSMEWFDYRVGGKSYGEVGQQAIWAGAFGAPVVMVSGDTALCAEINALLPEAATAEVKTAKYRNEAICLPFDEARKRIYEAAKDGMERCKQMKPYVIPLPTTVEVTYCRNDFCDNVYKDAADRCERDGRTLKKTMDEIISYRQMMNF